MNLTSYWSIIPIVLKPDALEGDAASVRGEVAADFAMYLASALDGLSLPDYVPFVEASRTGAERAQTHAGGEMRAIPWYVMPLRDVPECQRRLAELHAAWAGAAEVAVPRLIVETCEALGFHSVLSADHVLTDADYLEFYPTHRIPEKHERMRRCMVGRRVRLILLCGSQENSALQVMKTYLRYVMRHPTEARTIENWIHVANPDITNYTELLQMYVAAAERASGGEGAADLVPLPDAQVESDPVPAEAHVAVPAEPVTEAHVEVPAEPLPEVGRRSVRASAACSRPLGRARELELLCAERGVLEGDLLRTVFALLLAAERGHGRVSVVTAFRELFGPVAVASVALDPAGTLLRAAGEWRTAESTVGEGPSAAPEADALLDTLALPAFAYLAAGEADGLAAERFPLACTATRTPEGLDLSLHAGAETRSPAELEALADQFEAVIAALVERPGATLEELVRLLPALRFEIVIASTGDDEMLVPVLEHWAGEVGLPASARTAQLGEMDYGDAAPEFPPAPRSGAAVLLTRPEEWDAGRGTREFRPAAAPPAGSAVGRLPNGAAIVEKNPNETRELFDEVVARRAYMRQGVRIPDGATVVDVGANVGLFTLFAHHEATGVTVHAFEPAPEIADVLQANAEMYAVDAVVHRVALGAAAGTGEFTFYPRSTLQSGFHADEAADAEVVRRYARHQATDSARDGALPAGGELAQGIESLVSGRFQAIRRPIPVRTLSDVVDEYGIRRIDLLKVDVERAELDVLEGIREEHWPLVQQVAAEVHDIGGRLERFRSLLAERGFVVAVEQERLFGGTELHMVFARRPEYRAEEDAAATEAHHAALAGAASAWARHSARPVYVAVAPPADGAPRGTAVAALRARLAAEAPGIRFLDLAPRVAADSAGDEAAALGTAIFRSVTAGLRSPAKAVVVDADNVLWGGVCGEVGPENVSLGEEHLHLQEFLAQQRAAGRLLLLSSKNNLADVEEVFAAHPGMPLRLGDFAAVCVDWRSKAENISSMVNELGIAPESAVFVDDSPAERAEVRVRLPGVTVVELPDDPRGYVGALRATWALDLDELTAEDALRAAFVRDDALRQELASTSATFGAYLRQLRLEVEIADSTPDEADRIAQLARRTNQFNLTLTRHSREDAHRLLAGEVALSVRVTDRFGEYGLTGFLAGGREGDHLAVSDLFLSCRALGRNVEWAMLRALGERAAGLGLDGVRLTGRRGERNQPALAFLRHVASVCGGEWDAERLTVDVPSAALAAIDWLAVTPQAAPDAAPAPSRAGGGSAARGAGRRYRWPAPAAPAPAAQTLRRGDRERPSLSTPYAAPRTSTEAEVAAIWTELLGIERPGIHDDLIACGGDSLTALAICARVRRSHGVEIQLDAFLDRPTIERLAFHLDAAAHPAGTPAPAPAPAQAEPVVPEATHGQRRIWAADAAARLPGAQIIPLAYQVEGPLDAARLEAALAAVVERHEALRTVLVPSAGQILRMPARERFALRRAELAGGTDAEREAEVRERGTAFYAEPFDLSADLMLRALLLEGPGRHVLLLALHHSAGDGTSIGILQREIGAAYRDGAGAFDGDLAPGFSGYARWVREREARGGFADGLRALRSRLGAPGQAAAMRTDQERGSTPADPRFARFEISRDVCDAARRLAARHGATPASVFLASFQLLLAAHSRRERCVVGFPVANRAGPDHAEVVGFLANIVPVAADIDWSRTAADHVVAVGREVFEALRHSEVPYGLLLRELHGDPYRFDPPFEALFTYQSMPAHPLHLGECGISAVEPMRWPLPFEFMLDVEERSGAASALLRWDGGLFAPETAQGFIGAYPLVLRLISVLADEPLESAREMIRRVAGDQAAASRLAGPRRAPSLHDLPGVVERHAHANPDAIAARDERGTLSYAELLAACERIDAELAARGVEAGDCVAVCMQRRPLVLAAILAVLRRGAYFVPMDPGHPPARLQAVAADAAPRVTLVDDETAGIAPGALRDHLRVGAWVLDSPPAAVPPRAIPGGEDLAYLLYTSGSTGRPKGVEVTRRGLMNYLEWAADRYRADEGSGALLHSSLAFDLTVTTLFLPLLAGNTVWMVASDAPEALAGALRGASGLSFLKLTPSGLNVLGQLLTPAEIARAANHLVLGGEQLTARALGAVAGPLPVTNEYGPTETTVGSCAYTFRAGEPVPDPVPVGTPIWNTEIEILDASGAPCAPGVAGEIVIGGAGVARGYRGLPRETAARFRPHGEGRRYHTGDLGSVGADGVLRFHGRGDDQVKVHGYRVETAEVEAVLASFSGVAAAAVVPATRPPANAVYLSAFVVPGPGAPADLADQLYAWAAERLPMYARPDRLEVLQRLPLAPSGKTDRAALAARSAEPLAAPAESGDRSGKLETISRIWERLLGHPAPGPGDSFFALGGDSITALHLVAAARQEGLDLSMGDVLHQRTLGRIAAAARPLAARPLAAAAEARAPDAGPLPLTPAQEAFFALDRPDPHRWSLRWTFAAPEPLDAGRLAAAFHAVLERHPALRCRFRRGPAGWSAHVAAGTPAETPEVVSLRGLDDAATARRIALHLREAEAGLHLEEGPLVRLCAFDAGPGRAPRLAWVVHHLVGDVVSLQIMARELLDEYAGEPRHAAPDDGYAGWVRGASRGERVSFPGGERLPACRQLVRTHGAEAARGLTSGVVARERRTTTVVLAALVRALDRVQPGSPAEVCVENNGRVRRDLDLELPSTVGWLTTYQVFRADHPGRAADAELIGDLLEQGRAQEGMARGGELPDVGLNYLGDLGPAPDAWLPSQLVETAGEVSGTALLFGLELVCWGKGGELHSSWRYDPGRYGTDAVQRLADAFGEELPALLAAAEHAELELRTSDFPEADLSEDDLSRILSAFGGT